MSLMCLRYAVLENCYLKKYYIAKYSMCTFVIISTTENNKEQQRLNVLHILFLSYTTSNLDVHYYTFF